MKQLRSHNDNYVTQRKHGVQNLLVSLVLSSSLGGSSADHLRGGNQNEITKYRNVQGKESRMD